jgi:hypothetical protein
MRIVGAEKAAAATPGTATAARRIKLAPGQLLERVIELVRVSCDATVAAQLPLVLPFAAAAATSPEAAKQSSAGNSSRSGNNQSSSTALGQQAPFIASLLLTALKCAVCLRMQCPLMALHVAMVVAGIWVQPQGAPDSRTQQAFSLSHNSLAAVACGLVDPAMMPRQLRRMGARAKVEVLVTEEPLEFTPGGGTATCYGSSSSTSSSSSSGAAGVWYSDAVAATMVPWLTTAARSMWLIGQVVNELQTGSSSSSSSGSSSREPPETDSASQQDQYDLLLSWVLPRVLEVAVAAVEWIGSELCHMRLPGDVVADSSSTASTPLLLELLEQQLQLQQALHAAAKRCVAAAATAPADCDIRSAAVRSYLQQVWGPDLALQLRAFGAAVAEALPISWACNNAACSNLAKLSELQLVTGKAKVCSGCKQVRMCSAECHREHWKAGHKKVCKKLAATGAATALPATASSGSNAQAAARSESAAAAASAAACTSGSSTSANAASTSAAAGLELPASAAAAAALPVRQLKSLLAALGVAGLAGAVEKSDLVGLLVGALGLQ